MMEKIAIHLLPGPEVPAFFTGQDDSKPRKEQKKNSNRTHEEDVNVYHVNIGTITPFGLVTRTPFA